MAICCLEILVTIGSGKGKLPVWHQAITCTYSDLLLIVPLETMFQWNLNKNTGTFIQEVAFEHVGYIIQESIC